MNIQKMLFSLKSLRGELKKDEYVAVSEAIGIIEMLNGKHPAEYMSGDTASVYWMMLIELESKSQQDRSLIPTVDAGYRHWNRVKGTSLKRE